MRWQLGAMKLSLMLAGLGLIASPVLARSDTDYPHRDWGKVVTLDMTATEATTCLTRAVARRYERIVPVPVDGGTDIDAGPGGGLFGVAHDPWLRLRVRQEAGATTLRISYRHPVSQKQIDSDVGRFEKQCLRVIRITVEQQKGPGVTPAL